VNVLDENIREDQRQRLRRWRIRIRQVGEDVAQKGIQDESLIRLLQSLPRPTLFTRDQGLYDRRFVNRGYCIVCLGVGERRVAVYTRRFLKHPLFNTQRKRLGGVVLAQANGLRFWHAGTTQEQHAIWMP